MGNLRARLGRAEKRCKREPLCFGIVCLDLEGRILDDGRPGLAPWVGRPVAELPRPPRQLVAGIDPLVLLGLKPGLDFPGLTAAAPGVPAGAQALPGGA